jgi:hypothetical protein
MRSSLRALLAGALTLATFAVSPSAASAVTVNPVGPIDAQGTVLQVITIPSVHRDYTCIWGMQGQITQNVIPLVANLVQIGWIGAAQIVCNEPGVQIIPLVSPPGGGMGPWLIGLTPTTGVLGLPAPTGILVELLNVRIRVLDATIGFQCLYTGRIGLLVGNGPIPQGQLLGGQFVATPGPGDTCPAGLPLTKGPGTYNMVPPWFIGP